MPASAVALFYIDRVSVRLRLGLRADLTRAGVPSLMGALSLGPLTGWKDAIISDNHGTNVHGGRSVGAFFGWLILLTVSSLLLIGCTASEPSPTMTMTHSSRATQGFDGRTPKVTSAPLETVQNTSQIPVYWLGGSGSNVLLYREFRALPSQDDPITTAVSAMTTQQPLDPDYFNPWHPAATVGTSITSKNVITVDLSADAFKAHLDKDLAYRAVQQLVYTATAAAAKAGLISPNQQTQVAVLVDGHTGYKAFGQIDLGKPMSRDSSLAAPVWIIDPQQDTTLTGPAVIVKGRGVAFESTLNWTILTAGSNSANDGRRVTSGTVRIHSAAGQDGTYSFTTDLAPGIYEVRVFQKDMSGRTDKQLFPDSKVFTVKDAPAARNK